MRPTESNHLNHKVQKALYIQFTNPAQYPPLEQGSRVLVSQGWECLFLARLTEMSGKIIFEQMEGRKVITMPRITLQLPTKIEFVLYLLRCVYQSVVYQPTVIYVSDVLSTPIGALLSFLGFKIIYHEHDSPNERLPKYLAWSRKRVFKAAAATIVPNPTRLTKAEQSSIFNLIIVRNFPSKNEIIKLSPHRSSHIQLTYFGTIVPSRLPISFFQNLCKRKQDIAIQIMGYETIHSRGYFQKLKETFNNSSTLTFEYLGAMPTRFEMLHRASNADLGILLFSNNHDVNEKAMAGASNKICDYLAAGIPLISYSTPEFEILAKEMMGIYTFNEPDDVVSLIQKIKAKYSSLTSRQKLQQQIADKYNYEIEFKPVLNLLQQINRAKPVQKKSMNY